MKPVPRLKTLLGLSFLTLALAVSPLSHAQGNSGDHNNNANANANANANKSAMKNGENDFKGILRTAQHIYYVGDDLDISVKFARGADRLAEDEADAHIVIFSFDGNLISVPVGDDIGTATRQFFPMEDIDTSMLPEGQYQLALVLTVPGGDPTLLDDWYGGFRALLDTEAVFVSTESLEGDMDLDGEWDDDTDNDGIVGEEEDETDDGEDELEEELEEV